MKNQTLNSEELSIQLNEIKNMKYILNIENQDISYENLKMKIDSLCKYNLIHFIVLKNYLSEMPKEVKQAIDKIIDAEDNEELERKYYIEYINKYKTNQIFREYQDYIFAQRANDVIKDVEDVEELSYFKELKNSLVKYKHIQLALLFNILYDIKGLFVLGDFTDNLPQLMMWIKENKEKPIEKLTNDEGVILAALILGYYERIFAIDKLSNFVMNFGDVDEIINSLPKKFGVKNIVQVIFRIYLLKPHIWSNMEFDEIVKSIKSVGHYSRVRQIRTE